MSIENKNYLAETDKTSQIKADGEYPFELFRQIKRDNRETVLTHAVGQTMEKIGLPVKIEEIEEGDENTPFLVFKTNIVDEQEQQSLKSIFDIYKQGTASYIDQREPRPGHYSTIEYEQKVQEDLNLYTYGLKFSPNKYPGF